MKRKVMTITLDSPFINFIFTFAMLRLSIVLVSETLTSKFLLILEILPWILFDFIYCSKIKKSKWYYGICIVDYIFMFVAAIILFFVGFMKINNVFLFVVTGILYCLFMIKYVIVIFVELINNARDIKSKINTEK